MRIGPVVRKAKETDLPYLIPMARRFVNETSMPLTFDVDITTETFMSAIYGENSIFLVEEENGSITGGIMGAVDRDFTKEICSYITKMYVEAEFRGLGTSRSLVKAFQDESKRLGASIVFASSTAGMGERVEKLYVSLFERFGYKVLGRVLIKEL